MLMLLTLYSCFVGSVSIALNCHYLSQIVAGAGLGIIVGAAAYAVLEKYHLPANFEIGITTNQRGTLGIQVAYNF